MSKPVFDHTGKDLGKAKRLLLEDFPICSTEINDAFDCVENFRVIGAPYQIKDKDGEDNVCRTFKAKTNWCIIASFCPREAINFLNCNKGVIPGMYDKEESARIPFHCKFAVCEYSVTRPLTHTFTHNTHTLTISHSTCVHLCTCASMRVVLYLSTMYARA